jgi:hypothetical protein
LDLYSCIVVFCIVLFVFLYFMYFMCLGDDLFVFGGCALHDRLNDLWRYNSMTGKWEELHNGTLKLVCVLYLSLYLRNVVVFCLFVF